MSEQPPKRNDQPEAEPVDVSALLNKFNANDSSKQQPEDVADKVKALNQEITDNPAPKDPTSATDQIEAAWQQHDTATQGDSSEEALGAELAPKDQWAHYLFQQRNLRQLDDIVERKREEVLASGGTEEDFRRQLWSHHRDALEELSVITPEDVGTFNPMFTKDVVRGARQQDRELRERKKALATALGNNQELLGQVIRGIEADKKGYQRDHKGGLKDWDKRLAAASEISPLLAQLAERSDYDAHLLPGDFTGILSDAEQIASKQQQSAKQTSESQTSRQSQQRVPVEDALEGGKRSTSAQPQSVKSPLPRYRDGSIQDDDRDPYDGKGKLTGFAKARFEENQQKLNVTLPADSQRAEKSALREERITELTTELDELTAAMSSAPRGSEAHRQLEDRWKHVYDERAALKEQQLWAGIAMPGSSDPTEPSLAAQPNQAGRLPNIDLSGLESEKLSVAQQEERWMELVQQYGASSGDRSLRQQVSEAYDKLQEMRASPETLAALEQEFRDLCQQAGQQFDKNSPEARAIREAAATKLSEIKSLEQWQATNAKPDEAGQLPRIELPDDPLEPNRAGTLPHVELPDDPLNVEQNQQPPDLRRQLLEAAAAYEQAEEGEAKEQARARYEALQAQLHTAAHPPANEPLTKQAELDILKKAYLDESDPAKRIEKKKLFSDAYEAQKAQQERVAEETVKIRAEVANTVCETKDGKDITHTERLRAAMRRYAELKADSETKGIDIKLGKVTLWRGRSKREKLLKAAEADLMAAKIAYEKAVADKARDANLYEGTDEQVAAQCRNDLFTAVRGLDLETRQAVNDVLKDRDRNIVKRAAATIFGWMGKSGKLRTAGTVATGAAAGVGIVMSGAGWPITAAVVGGAKFAIYHGVKTKQLADMRSETVDMNGNAKGVMTDAAFEQLKTTGAASGARVGAIAEGIATEIFDTSRQQGYERVDRATQAARRAIGKFGIGVLIGAGGAGAYNWISSNLGEAAHATGGQVPGDDMKGKPIDQLPKSDPPPAGGDFEWPHGASRITSGEGWFSQFHDMGMSEKQAHAMFADKNVMAQLVKVGAAYPDSSSTIGGYGINMPKNGHLSEKAMDIIGKAMKAKGF